MGSFHAVAAEISPARDPGDPVSIILSEAMKVLYDDFQKAIVLLKEADSLAGITKDPEALSSVAHSFGVAYYVKGEYDSSLKYFLKGGEISRNHNNKVGVAKSLMGQGLIQQGIDRHSEAINLFRQVIQAYKEAEDYKAANPAFLNIAISEIDLGDYGKARKNLETAIELSKADGRKDVEHLALNKLGEISFREGDPKGSVVYHQMVLGEEPNGWEKSFAHAGLAQAFHKLGELDVAREHGLKSMEYATKAQSLWDLERNSKILSEIYAGMDSSTQALEYLIMNQNFKDSLYDQKKVREINLLQLESKEAENERLLAEKEVAEKRLFINKIITFLLVLVTIFLVLLLVLFQKKKKQEEKFHHELEEKNKTILEQNAMIMKRNKELDEINKSKDRFFSILSHDLKSPIGSIQQLLEMMKSGEFSPEEQSALLDEMLKQITGTSFMLHNLLHWASSQLENSKVKPESVNLPAEVDKVLRAYYWPAKIKNIEIVHMDESELNPILVDKAQLAVILHNLVSNAIKFTVEGRSINISYREGDGRVQLTVKDGGNGMTREKIKEITGSDRRLPSQPGTDMERGTGLGLLLVKEFVRANNARMEIESTLGKGSSFIVSFVKATGINK